MTKYDSVFAVEALLLLAEKYNEKDKRFDWQGVDWDRYFDLLDEIKIDRNTAIGLVSDNAFSTEMIERLFAATLAGAIMNPVEEHQREEAKSVINILDKMSETETSTDVLEAIATSLGYPYQNDVKQTLLKLSHSEDVDVRRSATISLGSLTVEHDEDVITRLQQLTDDPDADIRDWAEFNLEPLEV